MFFKIPIILIGNKVDLDKERAVSKDEGQSLASKFDCNFLEVSAKMKANVSQVTSLNIRKIG